MMIKCGLCYVVDLGVKGMNDEAKRGEVELVGGYLKMMVFEK